MHPERQRAQHDPARDLPADDIAVQIGHQPAQNGEHQQLRSDGNPRPDQQIEHRLAVKDHARQWQRETHHGAGQAGRRRGIALAHQAELRVRQDRP
jgi:hypothetical protein